MNSDEVTADTFFDLAARLQLPTSESEVTAADVGVIVAALRSAADCLLKHPRSHPQYADEDAAETATEIVISEEGFPFLFRARVTGTLQWTCPKCGRCHRTMLRDTTFAVRCTSSYCQRSFVLGWTLYVPAQGLRSMPPDMTFPATLIEVEDPDEGGPVDPMPLGEIGRWRSGELVHRLKLDRDNRRRRAKRSLRRYHRERGREIGVKFPVDSRWIVEAAAKRKKEAAERREARAKMPPKVKVKVQRDRKPKSAKTVAKRVFKLLRPSRGKKRAKTK
jgi:hypothetical protein